MELEKANVADKKILTRVYILEDGDLIVTDMWDELSTLTDTREGATKHGPCENL